MKHFNETRNHAQICSHWADTWFWCATHSLERQIAYADKKNGRMKEFLNRIFNIKQRTEFSSIASYSLYTICRIDDLVGLTSFTWCVCTAHAFSSESVLCWYWHVTHIFTNIMPSKRNVSASTTQNKTKHEKAPLLSSKVNIDWRLVSTIQK